MVCCVEPSGGAARNCLENFEPAWSAGGERWATTSRKMKQSQSTEREREQIHFQCRSPVVTQLMLQQLREPLEELTLSSDTQTHRPKDWSCQMFLRGHWLGETTVCSTSSEPLEALKIKWGANVKEKLFWIIVTLRYVDASNHKDWTVSAGENRLTRGSCARQCLCVCAL